MHHTAWRLATGVAATAALALAAASPAAARTLLDHFNTIRDVASTVPSTGPAAGDENPYGVAVVPHSVGDLVRGDVLVSNFNNGANQQGTGSSIVQVSPSGKASVFAVVPPPTRAGVTGLTTALAALDNGDVVVGNLPAPGGVATAASAGALTVLGPEGQVVRTITAPDINGPWDMTAADFGNVVVLFVTNVLNGNPPSFAPDNNGSVDRLVLVFDRHGRPFVASNQVIATGFTEHLDPNALVVGPTGVGLGWNDTLYVADSANNRIAAIPDALFRRSEATGGGMTVSENPALNDPLGLAITRHGNILTVNGGDGNLVETSPFGMTEAVKTLIPNSGQNADQGAGDLFGLAIAPHGTGVYFVNDDVPGGVPAGGPFNSLELLTR
jgi:hypothetical protein